METKTSEVLTVMNHCVSGIPHQQQYDIEKPQIVCIDPGI
jgi:hypothetical protein